MFNHLLYVIMKRFKENEPELRAELEKVWHGDKKMIDYCASEETDIIVKDADGKLFCVKKPHIKKDFCFGYSTCGQGMEYEDARRIERNFHEGQFYAANLREIQHTIEIFQGKSARRFYVRHGYGDDFNIWHWILTNEEERPCGAEEMKESTRLALLDAYKREYVRFEKRLHTWWKRYGMNYIHTWVYWVDD